MKRYFYLCLLLGLAFVLNFNTQAFAARALYDDFSGNLIDSSKWRDVDLVREVAVGNLVSKIANNTSTTNARNNTSFQNPSSIEDIECDITIVEVNLDTGTDNSSFARISGRFYNTLLNPGTEQGDVWAGLFIGNRGSGLEVWWEVFESLDATGDTWDPRGTGTLTVPGLDYGNAYTAKIDYDGASGFTFTVAGVSSPPIAGPAFQDAEFVSYKALETGAYGSAGTGYTSALFDDVLVNSAAYDDFSTSPLGQTNWRSDEQVREIASGKLRLNRQGFDELSQINLTFKDKDIPYIETKARIESSSQLSPGARGIVRIQGYYYNDSRGPGSGLGYNQYEGDVFARIQLHLSDNGVLSAGAWVGRSDANEITYTDLFGQNFLTPINFDTDYTLSIEFRESMLIFKCNDETLLYNITTPRYTPFGEHRRLRSRVYLDPGESGYIKAQLDDVYVDTEQAPATYDATGKWNYSTSLHWAQGPPGCDPDDPETGTVTITQNGNSATLDDGDQIFNGIVSGDTYYFIEVEEEVGETTTITVIFTLSDANSGSGQVTVFWTDGIDECYQGFDLSFTKKSGGGGGGGGCFISTAVR